MTLTAVVTSPQMGKLSDKIGPRPLMSLGLSSMAVACAVFSMVEQETPVYATGFLGMTVQYWKYFFGAFSLFGFGYAAAFGRFCMCALPVQLTCLSWLLQGQ